MLFFVSIAILFIGITLLFARLPGLVGIDSTIFWEFWGYEWPKTLWWYLLLPLTISLAVLAWKRCVPTLRTRIFWGVLFLLAALHAQTISEVFGTRFLPQGSLFIIALMLTAWVFSLLNGGQRSILAKLLLSLSIPIGAYAMLQAIGIDPLQHYYAFTPWQDARPFSTFGSPNTLSVFCLLLMPLTGCAWLSAGVQSLLKGWLLLTIAVTQSLSVLILALVYLIFVAYRRAERKQRLIMASLILIAIIAVALLLSTKWYVKYLSISSRYEIWINMVQGLSPFSLTTWIWHGPWSLVDFFQYHRSPGLSQHIAPHIPIDRAHNIVLDMLWNWWVVGLSLMSYLTFQLWKSSSHRFRSVLLLFFATGFFHTPLLVHYLIVLLGTNSQKNT